MSIPVRRRAQILVSVNGGVHLLQERFWRTKVHCVTCVSEKEARLLFLQASIMGQGVQIYAWDTLL
jgi:hypothetical protein